jgi:hypothetical protein
MKPTRGIASPFVEIEVTGVDSDSHRFKVKTCNDNGLCPTWNDEAAEFQLSMPELASIKFIVQDEDMFGDANTIGQNVFPLGSSEDWSLRSGAYFWDFLCRKRKAKKKREEEEEVTFFLTRNFVL